MGNWQFFCCGGKFSLRPEKKDTVVCLAVARSITTGKGKRYSRLSVGCVVLVIKTSFFVVAGIFYYDRIKKGYSCLSGGCAIIITTGKKRYSRLSGGCAIIIMTRKKKIQSSVSCHDHYICISST